MKATKLTFVCLFYLFSICKLQAQNSKTIEVRGRVIEVVNGKSVGVPNIKVISENINFTVTNPNGDFSFFLPINMQTIELSLEEPPNKSWTSRNRLVSIPPSKNLEIMLYRAENKRLKATIEQMNQKIKALERKNQLEKQNLAKITDILMDSIKSQEILIQTLEMERNEIKIASDNSSKESERRIQALEERLSQKDKQMEEIQQQLVIALEEKYLRQQAHLQLVAEPLRRYLDALKNLRDYLVPDKIYAYTSNTQAIQYLTKKVELYNDARNRVNDNQDTYVTGVKQYWQDASLSTDFQETLSYLLNTVHNNMVQNNYNKGIIDPLFHGKKTGRQLTEKKIKENASEAYPKMNEAIFILEEKINTTLVRLKNHF
jgi:hypothetical protein